LKATACDPFVAFLEQEGRDTELGELLSGFDQLIAVFFASVPDKDQSGNLTPRCLPRYVT